jgi:hypothetical protein
MATGGYEVTFILGKVVSFAGWLLVMWRYGKHLQIVYALYRVAVGFLGVVALLSKVCDFAERRLS